MEKQFKQPNTAWIIVGFIFAFLGGFIGMAFGTNYAFGNYDKTTKMLGWIMLIISFIMIKVALESFKH